MKKVLLIIGIIILIIISPILLGIVFATGGILLLFLEAFWKIALLIISIIAIILLIKFINHKINKG